MLVTFPVERPSESTQGGKQSWFDLFDPTEDERASVERATGLKLGACRAHRAAAGGVAMNLLDVVREVRRHLEENGRLSLRMLRRQFARDDDAMEEVIEELVDVQRVARREENALEWSGNAAAEPRGTRVASSPPARDPRSYTPKHLAEKILTSRSTLEGERKQVTVLFADVKGSMDFAESAGRRFDSGG